MRSTKILRELQLICIPNQNTSSKMNAIKSIFPQRLVKSLLTAGMFCMGISACADDTAAPEGSFSIADISELERFYDSYANKRIELPGSGIRIGRHRAVHRHGHFAQYLYDAIRTDRRRFARHAAGQSGEQRIRHIYRARRHEIPVWQELFRTFRQPAG